MSILNHFQQINLTNDQNTALKRIQDFLASESSVFVLNGYAGTGKTTVISTIVNNLVEIFDEKYYRHLSGGILEAFGKLFYRDLKVYMYPTEMKKKMNLLLVKI